MHHQCMQCAHAVKLNAVLAKQHLKSLGDYYAQYYVCAESRGIHLDEPYEYAS